MKHSEDVSQGEASMHFSLFYNQDKQRNTWQGEHLNFKTKEQCNRDRIISAVWWQIQNTQVLPMFSLVHLTPVH